MFKDSLPSLSEASLTTKIQNEGSHIENVWKRTMYEQYQIWERYSSVAALIVCWDDRLDQDLNCRFEVDELDKLFKDSFFFTSTVLKLDTRTRPQQQLNHAISELVFHHDGPSGRNLLIVYYSGHAIGRAEGELELCGIQKSGSLTSEGSGRYDPRVNWVAAERDLDLAEADVLIVLDCCCAANILKKDQSDNIKAHEVLASCSRSQKAEQPGQRSFTRHFIDALKEELDKHDRQPFTTFDLNEEITRRRLRKTNAESRIFHRHGNVRNRHHIALAPLDHLRPVSIHEETPVRPQRVKEAAVLDLRVSFRDRTNFQEDEIKNFATKMFEAAKSAQLGVNFIDWTKFQLC